ncbi:hypothetical protein [Nocardiopsis ansamitocini]|uniref:Uncharacterized protein n=1 Tax=Nocardiopsis ansamitocini TaxID=1670832 RepID=A0A9W6PAU4_9ACTN|nr:hypothetical protein [Nocardiopsis ansamitocini]GLU50184.1 hypothetical protein Nans01_45350 [Nocardiopsis ansamitocini]
MSVLSTLALGIGLLAPPANSKEVAQGGDDQVVFSDQELLAYGDLTRTENGKVSYSIDIVVYDDGTIIPADAPTTLGRTNTSLSNGVLHLETTYCQNVVVRYNKTAGNTITRRLGYQHGGSQHFRVWQNHPIGSRSNSWNNLRLTGNVIGMMDVLGQGLFMTPPIPCR